MRATVRFAVWSPPAGETVPALVVVVDAEVADVESERAAPPPDAAVLALPAEPPPPPPPAFGVLAPVCSDTAVQAARARVESGTRTAARERREGTAGIRGKGNLEM
jgi:hypothetical protein